MTAILETSGLTKRYGARTSVNNLSITVNEGDIYGFLGLNGAGKTTTIRMVLNLIKPTAGSVRIFGKDVRRHFLEIARDVGALVELPAFYPYLSAWKNLEVLRLATGGVSKNRIGEVLEMVRLADRAHDRVRSYSQGMRQRLGIAQALLARPRLVILDEPTNGLDPHGMKYFREMIQELNKKEGATFLISSHLLHEIELSATRVAIIKEGNLVIEETVSNILARTVNSVRIRAHPAKEAAAVAGKMEGVQQCVALDDGALQVFLDRSRFAHLNAELHRNNLEVSEFAPVKMSLEEYFLSR
ncbi:MAG: hypothetical protein A2Z34_10570 [Planctomycetes bacterium RBG_16_59_8]|nr:MAG: hypothetical protein A2Z34_10570 [Planctomycetes bacterium RBG_16_59_8]